MKHLLYIVLFCTFFTLTARAQQPGAPQIAGPVCKTARAILIKNVQPNASIVLLRNGHPVDTARASANYLVLPFDAHLQLATNDLLSVRQYQGTQISALSNQVSVVEQLQAPSIEITGGHPFFNPEAGEEAIDAPVFPRGASPVIIHAQSCCRANTEFIITSPVGEIVARAQAKELYPGYFLYSWDWQPANIQNLPIGEYQVRVKSQCLSQEAQKKFYVVFDPRQVNGPARFTYSETNIWFGTSTDGAYALHYTLHPDDRRIFSLALRAASGITHPKIAAMAIADTEAGLFGYSLDYQTQDALEMLTKHKEAQCADDAAMLVSMLRAVGIPAHTVTADAAIETKAADWTFDTWVEFLVPTANGNEWLVLHPHEFPYMLPEARITFGTTRRVATKEFNDVLITTNENWTPAEVSDYFLDVAFRRNECREPVRELRRAAWVEELCERYWPRPHWLCPSDERLLATERLELKGNLSYGNNVSATLASSHSSGHKQEIIFEIVGDLPESKKFPDTVMVSSVWQEGKPFFFRLPDTRLPGQSLFVRVRRGDYVFHMQPVKVTDLIKTELQVAGSWQVGQVVQLTAFISNTGKREVTGILPALLLPPNIEAVAATDMEALALQPGEKHKIQWELKVTAPVEVTSIQLRVASANGGASEARLSVTVEE